MRIHINQSQKYDEEKYGPLGFNEFYEEIVSELHPEDDFSINYVDDLSNTRFVVIDYELF